MTSGTIFVVALQVLVIIEIKDSKIRIQRNQTVGFLGTPEFLSQIFNSITESQWSTKKRNVTWNLTNKMSYNIVEVQP